MFFQKKKLINSEEFKKLSEKIQAIDVKISMIEIDVSLLTHKLASAVSRKAIKKQEETKEEDIKGKMFLPD